EPDAAVDQRGRDRVGQTELSGVRRSRFELGVTWLADDRHFTSRHPAFDLGDRLRRQSVLAPERERAIEVGVQQVAARKWFVADGQRLPFTAERLERCEIGRATEHRGVETEAPLEDGRGPAEAAARQRRGDGAAEGAAGGPPEEACVIEPAWVSSKSRP